ncbi:MAG: stage III sporulation protein AE [Amphibacillus sp.]|nr:stage III sporulation protein AE [Amphibacillus sp.]
MTKCLNVLILCILLCLIFQIDVQAESVDSKDVSMQPDSLLDEIDVSELESYWSDVRSDYSKFIPNVDRLTVRDLITNQGQLTFIDWVIAILQLLGQEIFLNGQLLGQLILIAIISALLKNIQSSFQSNTVTVVANFVLMMILTTIAVSSFTVISELIIDTISKMHDFIIAILPLILGLMAMLGGLFSASFFHPLIISFLYFIVVLVDKVVLVLIFLSLVLHLVSQMNQTFQLTKLADLLRKISLGLLFMSLTIFLTILSAKGTITAVQDGLGIKTAKFVTNNFIPVVGRMLSEATDTIFATTQVIKNGLGLFGLITILLVVCLPIIKVAVIGGFYKFAAAILQPIGDDQVVKSISIISDHVFYLLAILVVVSFMFLMIIVVLLIASNLTLMIR